MRNILRKAKRGFTLVELSIVIAVIALLAAVLIPTFTNVLGDAEVKTVRVAAEEEISYYLADQITAADTSGDYIVTYNGYAFLVDDGKFKDDVYYDLSSGKSDDDDKISLTCTSGYTNITITLVTNSKITSSKTDISSATDVAVNNEAETAVITVNAQITTGDSRTVCAINTIKADKGEITSGDSDYSYLHDGAAIYLIEYSA